MPGRGVCRIGSARAEAWLAGATPRGQGEQHPSDICWNRVEEIREGRGMKSGKPLVLVV